MVNVEVRVGAEGFERVDCLVEGGASHGTRRDRLCNATDMCLCPLDLIVETYLLNRPAQRVVSRSTQPLLALLTAEELDLVAHIVKELVIVLYLLKVLIDLVLLGIDLLLDLHRLRLDVTLHVEFDLKEFVEVNFFLLFFRLHLYLSILISLLLFLLFRLLCLP